jgi:hypothetical protein
MGIRASVAQIPGGGNKAGVEPQIAVGP